jgi:hypothetical protein
MTGQAKASHCDEAQRLGTWHPSGRRPTLARLSGPAVRQVGTVARAEQCPKLIPSPDFSLRIVIRVRPGVNRDAGARSPAVRGAEPVILFSHCTMVITIRASDKASFRAQISNFYVITCLSSYDKVVDL